MTIRVLVVDDEPLARVALLALLREWDELEVLGEANSVESAVRQVRSLEPDLIFLDVRMRDGLGFEVLAKAASRAQVVFVTAYEDHALRAFEVDATDYLVKPVHRAHLARALDRVVRRRGSNAEETPLLGPSEPELSPATPNPLRLTDRLRLQRDSTIVFAQVAEIRFLRAARDYTEVHLASGRSQTVQQSLASWEAKLPEAFVRVHRSLLVNLSFVRSLSMRDGRWELELDGGDEILPVSRRLVRSLKERLPNRWRS